MFVWIPAFAGMTSDWASEQSAPLIVALFAKISYKATIA